MPIRKSIILIQFIFSSCLIAFGQMETNYARSGVSTSIEIDWTAYNHGTIQWQSSTDATSWNNIQGATNATYTFTPSVDSYYRAEIKSQEECEPTYITKQIKVVQFTVNHLSSTEKSAEFEVSNLNLNGAKVVEYGFCYTLSELNSRSYRDMQTVKAGNEIPSETTFDVVCENLMPGTTYSIRIYFKTEDGSMIYGPGKIAKTLPGLKWTAEDWTISKTTIGACFELADYNSIQGNPNVVFKFGTSSDNLQPINVTNLGNFKYASALVNNLLPNTSYIAQAEATIDGELQIIQKEVKTLPDYSGIVVDNSPTSVKHTISWDATKTLHQISPTGLQAEYPRIIRISQDTLLCSYHGGSGSDHWVNIYLQKSYDNGQTWTEPSVLMDKEKSSIGSRYWRFANPEMIKLKNGWIVMSFIGNGNPETNDNCHVMVITSKDNGQTWSDPIIVGRGRTWEPMIVQLPNGELEMLVASEAAWYPGSNLAQEIFYSRSTDNGQTWTEFKRASYSPNRRDGMPVAIVMQGNKGILYTIEIVNDGGFGSPSVLHRPLDGEWDGTDWDGVSDDDRWKVDINGHGGAPYMIQLPTGEVVLSAHTNGRNGIWQTSYPRIVVGDSNGKNFTTPVTPLSNLPASEGAYYNSLFLKDENTVWLVVTHSLYEGTTRKKGEIKFLEGKIVEKK